MDVLLLIRIDFHLTAGDNNLDKEKGLIPINKVFDIVVSSCHVSESKSIELKSFVININYNIIISSIVVTYS